MSGADVVSMWDWFQKEEYCKLIWAFSLIILFIGFIKREKLGKFCKGLLPYSIWKLPKICPRCRQNVFQYIPSNFIKHKKNSLEIRVNCRSGGCQWAARIFKRKKDLKLYLSNNPNNTDELIY